MGCCLGSEESISAIKEVVESYHSDYKIFSINRTAINVTTYKTSLGVVVLPSDINSKMFEDLMKLSSKQECIKVVSSSIDQRDSKMVDLFVLEIEANII